MDVIFYELHPPFFDGHGGCVWEFFVEYCDDGFSGADGIFPARWVDDVFTALGDFFLFDELGYL